MADFDRTASIKRLTGDAFGRVIFDHDLSDHPLHAIDCGVIFVHAFWASSSVRSLANFCKSIVRVDADCRLCFIVCDIDDIPSCDPVLYGGDTSGGNGDVFWISHGRIVARHTASRSCDFDTANASLIQWCAPDRRNRRIADANGVTMRCTEVAESSFLTMEYSPPRLGYRGRSYLKAPDSCENHVGCGVR